MSHNIHTTFIIFTLLHCSPLLHSPYILFLSGLLTLWSNYGSSVKLFFILFPLAFIILKHLPEGSSLKSGQSRWDGSWIILYAFLRQQELYMSSREGRGQPLIFSAVLRTLWSAFFSPEEPLTHAVCRDALYLAQVIRHWQFLVEVVVPQRSEEMQSLLCLHDYCCGVNTRSVVLHLDS